MRVSVDQARERLARVLKYAQERDHEAAHLEEDMLHKDALLTIARGQCDDPAALADVAARTLGIDFQRWCA